MTEKEENSCKDLNTIEILIAVLESGNSIELPATGYSMFPAFMPGDRVIVKPFPKGEIPKPGSVVVYKENSGLVMHRLVQIIDDDSSGKPLFITRGDSRMEPDRPVTLQQLIGMAVNYKDVKKEHFVKTFVPGVWRYKYNRMLFWLYNKLKRRSLFHIP